MKQWLGCLVFLAACGPEDSPYEVCQSHDGAALALGKPYQPALVPLMAGDQVTVSFAPQGGFGIPVAVQTMGLAAGKGRKVGVKVESNRMGQSSGAFELESLRLPCLGPEAGGYVDNVFVPLDTPESIEMMDGDSLELVVTFTDDFDRVAETRLMVILDTVQ